MRKFADVTDRGANAVKVLYAGLEIPAPFGLAEEEWMGLKEGGGFADGGGRGGSDDGGCGVEDDGKPGGSGKDMMNGCPEARSRCDVRRTESLSVKNHYSSSWVFSSAICQDIEALAGWL